MTMNKTMKKLLILLLFFPICTFAQDDLLEEIDTAGTVENYEIAAFKALKIVNFESTKMVPARQFYFIVAHRFGSIKSGFKDFFGLDNALTRLNFVYGITEGINLGISRSSFEKTYEGSLKLRLLRQKKGGFPLNIVSFNSVLINTALDKDNLPGLEFQHRISYASQLLISSKLSNRFSAEIAPGILHDNLVSLDGQDNTQYAIGVGGRYKLSNRFSLNADYGIHLNRVSDSPFRNPLSIGVDIETGGHVFQLHFTNAQPMNVNTFMNQATGDWSEGDIYFGFNLVRVF